jgi:hypothetical protein
VAQLYPRALGMFIYQSQSQSHITTIGQSVSMSWCRAQSGTFGQRFFFQSYCLVFFWGALSDERSGPSFVSLCQYSLQWSVSIYINYLHSVLHTFPSYSIYPSIFTLLYTFTIDYNKIQHVQYIQASFSPGFVHQIMPYLLHISFIPAYSAAICEVRQSCETAYAFKSRKLLIALLLRTLVLKCSFP